MYSGVFRFEFSIELFNIIIVLILPDAYESIKTSHKCIFDAVYSISSGKTIKG